jgi:hypothetical protein
VLDGPGRTPIAGHPVVASDGSLHVRRQATAGAAVVEHEHRGFNNHPEPDQIDDATARERVLH